MITILNTLTKYVKINYRTVLISEFEPLGKIMRLFR